MQYLHNHAEMQMLLSTILIDISIVCFYLQPLFKPAKQKDI